MTVRRSEDDTAPPAVRDAVTEIMRDVAASWRVSPPEMNTVRSESTEAVHALWAQVAEDVDAWTETWLAAHPVADAGPQAGGTAPGDEPLPAMWWSSTHGAVVHEGWRGRPYQVVTTTGLTDLIALPLDAVRLVAASGSRIAGAVSNDDDDSITVPAAWVRGLYEAVQYTIEVTPKARHIEWLVSDLHGRLTKLLHERSELEKRLAERDAEIHRLRSEVAALRAAGDELAREVEERDTPYGPLAREVQAWWSAAGSPATEGGDQP